MKIFRIFGLRPWRTCVKDSFLVDLRTYKVLLCWIMTFAGVVWGSCIQVLFLSIETTIGRFSIEMLALQKADLLPTFSAPVVRSLKEHVWWFNFIRDADPQLAALLVTSTFWWYSLKNLTFMPSDDFTGFVFYWIQSGFHF